jgi:DNA-binding Xre family transcriptional regulator
MKEETKQKISKSMMGKNKSPEHIEKIKQSNLGKKRSDKTKNKIKLSKELVYKIISPHGREYFIKTSILNKFCEAFKLNRGSLLNCCLWNKQYKDGWTIILLGKFINIFGDPNK